ncbi:hypothetical protein AB0K00_13895 [Dactylosporangium sp. NPDC049525]|uniref:ImmA/IrrE family metallo-endopeptidase n=1 Tax=Dactylosporangium sp. NPDC049525 TaxID=3154730 RepID=UPI003416DD9A
MCDVVGCGAKSTGAVKIPTFPDVGLCAAHQLAQRHRCACCGRVVRVGAAKVVDGERQVIESEHYDGTHGIDLCAGCDATRERCPGCGKTVGAKNRAVIEGTVPVGTPQVRVCGTCRASAVQCAACDKLVRMGADTRVDPRSVSLPQPSNIDLCGVCVPRRRTPCAGCGKVVKVGVKDVAPLTAYHNRELFLCGGMSGCAGKVSSTCTLCAAPVRLTTGTLTGAIEILNKKDEVVAARCPLDAKDVLAERPKAEKYFDEVLGFMDEWAQACGSSLPTDFRGRVTWQLAGDHELAGDELTQTLGLCVTRGTAKYHNIKVLTHLAPLRFQRTAAHELAHAFANEIGFGTRSYIEGYCNYVASRFLQRVIDRDTTRRAAAAALLAELTGNTDLTYGAAFVKISAKLATSPAEAVKFLRNTATID